MKGFGNLIISGTLTTLGTGSCFKYDLDVAGYVSASTFCGDGSNLTGISSYTDADTTLLLNSCGVVSGSSQISYPQISNIPSGIVSGSSQISAFGYTTCVGDITGVTAGSGMSGGGVTGDVTIILDTGSLHFTNGVKSKLNTDGVVSGSIVSNCTNNNLVTANGTANTLTGQSNLTWNGTALTLSSAGSCVASVGVLSFKPTATYVSSATSNNLIYHVNTSQCHIFQIGGTPHMTVSNTGIDGKVTCINNTNGNASLTMWCGSQSQYDAIGTKSSTTIYFIV
jgi:hypothetical protein